MNAAQAEQGDIESAPTPTDATRSRRSDSLCHTSFAMTVCQHRPSRDTILAVIDDEVRALQELGAEPHAILVGPAAYEHLRKAIGALNQRGAGCFETYRYLPIVVDPSRAEELTVVPKPRTIAEGVRCLER